MRRNFRLLVILLAISLAFSLLGATSSRAVVSYVEGDDLAAPLYDPLKVNDIDLEISDSNIEALYWDHETYVPAKFSITIDGVKTGPLDVGVRVKGGWGSLRSIYQKCSFRIKFNFVVPKQKFMGLKKLVLNNLVQDASMIHEPLAYRFMRAVGVPASRTGYANVTVNDELYGLYLNLEAVDKTMLSRWFNGTTHLFEGAYWTDVIPEHFWNFELDEGDPITYENYLTSNMWKFVNLQTLSGDQWFDAISEVADMKEITRLFAAELFLGHWDGYTHSIWNNYYVHFDNDGIISLVPSGMDQTWGGGYLPLTDPWGRGILFQKCLEVPRCYEMYMGAIGRVKSVFESMNLSTMSTEISQTIRASVEADWKKEYGTDWTLYLQSVFNDNLVNRTAGLDSLITEYKPNRPQAFISREKLLGTVTWNNVSPNFVPLVGHQIRISTNNSNWTDSEVITEDSFSFPLTPGATTYVRVRTINDVGPSQWSNSASLYVPALPPTPTPTVTRNIKDFQISWEDLSSQNIEISSYDVALSADQQNWTITNQTSLSKLVQLDFGQSTFVKVRSLNSSGTSNWSTPQKLTVENLPKISKLKFANKKKRVLVSWTAAQPGSYTITGYELSSSTNKSTWSAPVFVSGTSRLMDQISGKTRFYRIRVLTNAGSSAWSIPIKYARK